jgi:mannitol operon transcriptional antiterminator
LDSRGAQILVKIRDSEKPVTIKQLSDAFQISERTVRYDLNKIDTFLSDCQLPQLIRKPNSGIHILLDQTEMSLLNRKLVRIGTYYYTLSPEERRHYILMELIASKDYITIQSLAEKLSVSRSTVISDLKELRAWAKNYPFQIVSKTKEGIRIKGDEKKLRKLFMEILLNHVDPELIVREIQEQWLRPKDLGLEKEFRELFSDIDIGFIETCIQLAEKELNSQFSDAAYSGIVLHIAMALKRIQIGNDIVISKEELKTLTVTKEFSVASGITHRLENHFQLKIPVDEIGYITMHLLGASNIQLNKEIKHPEYQFIIQTMLGTIEKLTGENLSEDTILYRGLMEHLGPLIYRLQHELHLKNPLLNEIEGHFPDLFNNTLEAIRPIEAFTGHKMTKDEVSYFTLHLAAALERAEEKRVPPTSMNVLLVCSTGIGTAQILSTRLRSLFQVNLVDCISSRHVEAFLNHHYIDLIISTLELPKLDQPVVVVHPLLNEKDLLKLTPYLGKPSTIIKSDYEKLLEVIKRNCQILSPQGLEKELTALLSCPPKEVGEAPMLKDLLTKDVIRTQVDVNDWEEAVTQCGELLVATGAAQDIYVSAMIQSVKTIGPYIVIAPGIAMPHARPEDGALRSGFSLITLKNPIRFGNKANDPVSIVVCVCSADHSSHLKALSELVELLGNEENVKSIREAQSVEVILELLQE